MVMTPFMIKNSPFSCKFSAFPWEQTRDSMMSYKEVFHLISYQNQYL